MIPLRHHYMAQYRAAKTLTLELRGQVEVFNPLLIGLGADRDDPRRGGCNIDNKGVRRVKTVEEALSNAHWIPASETFEIGLHNPGTELRHP